jgi:hypothetical protein
MNKSKEYNILLPNQYIISPELQEALETGNTNKDKNKSINKNFNGIYLLMFIVLKKDINVLVYNYVYYNPLFLQCLVVYFILKVEFSNDIGLNERNDYLTIIDDELVGPTKHELILNKNNRHLKYLLDYIVNYNIEVEDFQTILLKINKLILIVNCDKMSCITDLAYKKDYVGYIREILGNIEGYNLFEKSLSNVNMENKESINIINGCLFLVNNLNLFIDGIKKKGYIINGGPQA